MKKAVFSILLLLILTSILCADYYDGTEGLYGDELKAALYNIIKDHIEYTYADLRDSILLDTDEDPSNPDNVILIYTGRSQDKDTFGGSLDEWNREHVWAKSHGDFGTIPPCGTDAHHIRPSDVGVNSTRGNKDFDNGGDAVYGYYGNFAGNTDSDSFEPRDEAKGDIARMIMYMAVRYEGENGEPDLEMVDYIPSSPDGQPYHGKESTLIQWHLDDPVDSFEMTRNEKIYTNWQHNRNPFIDHPEFAERIWCYGVNDPEPILPGLEMYPNPAHHKVAFSLNRIQGISEVSCISIYDVRGRLVCIVPFEGQQAVWTGQDQQGKEVATGIYFCVINYCDSQLVEKVTILR